MLFMPLDITGKEVRQPKSRMKRVEYHVRGGMMAGDEEYVLLWRGKDGAQTLTLKADCLDERLTFDVPDSVFERCELIINETEMWRHKGTYNFEGEARLLDAPKSSFTVGYEDKEETFWIDGNFVPNEASSAMEILIRYLKSLRGNRDALGHVIAREGKLEVQEGSQWTNGDFRWICDEKGIDELLSYLCQKYHEAYHREEWRLHHISGSGFEAIQVSNASRWLKEVLVSESTENHMVRTDEEIPGRWPETARRLITHKDLDSLPTDSVQIMCEEIRARYGFSIQVESCREYFRQQPWYQNLSWEQKRMTDLEHMNYEFIYGELRRREYRTQPTE